MRLGPSGSSVRANSQEATMLRYLILWDDPAGPAEMSARSLMPWLAALTRAEAFACLNHNHIAPTGQVLHSRQGDQLA